MDCKTVSREIMTITNRECDQATGDVQLDVRAWRRCRSCTRTLCLTSFSEERFVTTDDIGLLLAQSLLASDLLSIVLGREHDESQRSLKEACSCLVCMSAVTSDYRVVGHNHNHNHESRIVYLRIVNAFDPPVHSSCDGWIES